MHPRFILGLTLTALLTLSSQAITHGQTKPNAQIKPNPPAKNNSPANTPKTNAPEKGTFFVEQNCQVTTKTDKTLKLGDRFPLKIADEDYQFYTGRFFDGGIIACLARRDLTNPQVLNLSLTAHIVQQIKPDPTVANAFVIEVHEGNGIEVPVTHWGVVFKSTQPESINLNLLRAAGRFDRKPVTHRFQGKSGQSVNFHLDSRAKAGFTLLNSKGQKITTGIADKASGAIVKATIVLPSDDTYQVIISPNKTPKGSYALSVNLNQIR